MQLRHPSLCPRNTHTCLLPRPPSAPRRDALLSPEPPQDSTSWTARYSRSHGSRSVASFPAGNQKMPSLNETKRNGGIDSSSSSSSSETPQQPEQQLTSHRAEAASITTINRQVRTILKITRDMVRAQLRHTTHRKCLLTSDRLATADDNTVFPTPGGPVITMGGSHGLTLPRSPAATRSLSAYERAHKREET